ncbi:efflux RND transporter periplasmic adaptor subunit [Mucilaginibacter ginsenosidivorax]|uniref:Efflux RND transporter periplasmic adaptor subunit n=1 Tax=Mucilaginibacter ginsenosidivorax TaxID=862126 RepID=A0A5B8W799_9SPHI|nr:efflux RND transporter periplasmic adaptor subunit [Mucilaginibacter ginsenosidivorax]QEC78815.1 efflux RND transporter periplasmic adaptor subunit [Mucilaginibacter ginsenosidivorax]
MNSNYFLKYFFLMLLAVSLFTGCKQKPQVPAVKTAVQPKAYYTCSMHPQVHEDHPGNCPICGMKLIKVGLTAAAGDAAHIRISLTATQQQLAAIQTDTIGTKNTAAQKMLTGTVTTDETAARELSARTAGRVQQLFIRAIGDQLTTGQPVYTLYSEDLLEAEKEYLLARQQQKLLHNPDVDYKQLTASAESRLRLWGLSSAQINNLATSGKAAATTTILSNVSGTVSEIGVHEGDYVTEGMTILKTQSLNNLWVEAQLYAGESGGYKINDRVTLSFPDLDGQTTDGKIAFISPELSDASKVNLLRISVPNPQGLLRPGMLAYVSAATGSNQSLAVPASAVLTDGKGNKVWIKNTDGSFSPRKVTVGPGNRQYVPVLSGLNNGDVVVTNGTYLLNSEAIFKNGNEADMSGMKMQ